MRIVRGHLAPVLLKKAALVAAFLLEFRTRNSGNTFASLNHAHAGSLKCLTEADGLFSCYARGSYARHITNHRSFLLAAG